MCYLIHIGVPAKHAASVRMQRVPRVDALHNPFVSAAFGASFATFGVTDGGCACNLYSSPDAPAADRDDPATSRRKYERLGWSEAKIARALAASAEASSHRHPRTGLREDVVELVSGLVQAAGEVRLLVHHYHGKFARERVGSQGTRIMSANELRNGGGSTIAEDLVYIIRP